MKKHLLVIAVISIVNLGDVFAADSSGTPNSEETSDLTSIPWVIDHDVTVDVPGKKCICPHHKMAVHSIQDALKCLDKVIIAPGATVTIKLTQGASNYDSINVDHPNGNRIKIVGDCGGGKACNISFKPGTDGVVVAKGNHLALLDNLSLIGRTDPGVNERYASSGILASYGGNIICGENVTVQKFSCGVRAINNSHIDAPRIKSYNNILWGIFAVDNSSISAPYSVTNYNGIVGSGRGTGIGAYNGSTIVAPNAEASHNVYAGIIVERNSSITARSGLKVEDNVYGVSVSETSAARIDGSNISDNKNYGLAATHASSIVFIDIKASGNGGGIRSRFGSIISALGKVEVPIKDFATEARGIICFENYCLPKN